MAVTFDLPTPPSTNNMFINHKTAGRIRSPKYRAWRDAAGWEINRQKVPPVKGPVHIRYDVTTKSRIDLGNHEKALGDVLVSMGVIEDDKPSIVKGISLWWATDTDGVRVTIERVEG